MTDPAVLQQKELLLFKADYLARYGMDMDDWTAVTMLEYQVHFDKLRMQLTANVRENRRLSETFKGSIRYTFAQTRKLFATVLGGAFPCSLRLDPWDFLLGLHEHLQGLPQPERNGPQLP